MKENLEVFTVSQLRERAKELGITGRWEMTKKQLIDEVEKVTSDVTDLNESEEKKDSQVPSEMSIGEIKEYDKDRRMKFVENVSIGSIVAFRCFSGSVKSAKVIEKNEEKRKLILETSYGRIFEVNYEDVLWVRMGSRWPKGIIALLKANIIR